MDRRERFEDPQTALLTALLGHQTEIWTALPGIIESFDPVAMTCTVLPTIQARITSKEDGSTSWVTLPVLLDCPVFFPSGGGATLTFPITAGDECLVVFASRCIDQWWAKSGVQPQSIYRMHDLSDGFAFVGVRSQPNSFSVNTSATQLRTNDGSAYVEVNVGNHNVNVVTPANVSVTAGGNISANATGNISAQAGGTMVAQSGGAMSLTAPTISLTGAVTITGTLSQSGGAASMSGNLTVGGTMTATTDVVGGGKSLKTHVHSGVTAGGSNTGAPV